MSNYDFDFDEFLHQVEQVESLLDDLIMQSQLNPSKEMQEYAKDLETALALLMGGLPEAEETKKTNGG